MAHARLQTPSNNSWRDIALGSNDAAACDGFGLEHLIDLQRARQMGEMA
tara:strand:- start:261 stop:407 length:147 start_codon:yes stop_codon:yes gene_type:complete